MQYKNPGSKLPKFERVFHPQMITAIVLLLATLYNWYFFWTHFGGQKYVSVVQGMCTHQYLFSGESTFSCIVDSKECGWVQRFEEHHCCSPTDFQAQCQHLERALSHCFLVTLWAEFVRKIWCTTYESQVVPQCNMQAKLTGTSIAGWTGWVKGQQQQLRLDELAIGSSRNR
jgi:hypothetical protein